MKMNHIKSLPMKKLSIYIAALLFWASCTNKKQEVKTWYDTGRTKLKEKYFVQRDHPALKEDSYKAFYESGKILAEKNYVHGNLQGLARLYFENGQVKEEAEFKDSLPDGQRKLYNEQGI